MNVHTKSQRLAAQATVTGSIVAVMSTVDDTQIDDYKFGDFVQTGDFNINSSSIHQTSTNAIALPTGKIVEGPFVAFHLSNHAGTIVYYNWDIKVS